MKERKSKVIVKDPLLQERQDWRARKQMYKIHNGNPNKQESETKPSNMGLHGLEKRYNKGDEKIQ
jgi:hypothetical protein